jgi:hypothetical protein
VTFPFESAEEYVQNIKAIAAPIVAMISVHPEDVQRETWDAIADAVRERADGDGRISVSNQVWVAAGQA